jgi:WD40 repeat protein
MHICVHSYMYVYMYMHLYTNSYVYMFINIYIHIHVGHLNSISACAFHPKKPIFATASDDETWKLWTLPNCELVMSGEGHTSWYRHFDCHLYACKYEYVLKLKNN